MNTDMDKEYLKQAAAAIEAKLPDNHGFLLLVTPFSDGVESPVVYISNARRESAIKMLKEFLFRIGEAEDWMKHIS